MGRRIMISDIHGCSNTFMALLEQINFTFDDELFLLGDYVDRGPQSKAVLDHIIRLMDEGYQIICLRGNHEEMLISNYLAETQKGWFNMADEELLSSFGIANLTQLDEAYIEFCKSLAHYHLNDDFIAVHAGINFAHADPFAHKRDLLWIREWYDAIDYDWLGSRLIIHGHSPQTRVEIEEQFKTLDEKRVLNIDAGAFLSKQKKHGLGHLCAFDFTNQQLSFQENIERKNQY